MPEQMNFRLSGAWELADSVYARISGAWQECDECYARVSGAWELVHSSEIPPTITSLTHVRGPLNGGTCTGDKCNGCVYWQLSDAVSGDTVDVAYKIGTGVWQTFVDDGAYNANSTRCTQYSWTGDAQYTACLDDANIIYARVEVYRSAVLKDSDSTAGETGCGAPV